MWKINVLHHHSLMAISAQPEEHIIMEIKFVYSVPWEGEDLRKSSVKEENGHHPLPVLVSTSVKDDNWTEMILQPMPNFLERLSLYICKTVILPLLKGLRDKVLHILQAIGVTRFFLKKGWARWIQLWHLPWKTRIITFYSESCLSVLVLQNELFLWKLVLSLCCCYRSCG